MHSLAEEREFRGDRHPKRSQSVEHSTSPRETPKQGVLRKTLTYPSLTFRILEEEEVLARKSARNEKKLRAVEEVANIYKRRQSRLRLRTEQRQEYAFREHCAYERIHSELRHLWQKRRDDFEQPGRIFHMICNYANSHSDHRMRARLFHRCFAEFRDTIMYGGPVRHLYDLSTLNEEEKKLYFKCMKKYNVLPSSTLQRNFASFSPQSSSSSSSSMQFYGQKLPEWSYSSEKWEDVSKVNVPSSIQSRSPSTSSITEKREESQQRLSNNNSARFVDELLEGTIDDNEEKLPSTLCSNNDVDLYDDL